MKKLAGLIFIFLASSIGGVFVWAQSGGYSSPASGGGGGLSGMTAGQIPVAATATTITSSVATSGSGSVCLTTSCVMTTPNLGTPSAATLTNATGLPAASVLAGALASGMTATSQSAGDNSTKLATTAYIDAIPKTKALGWAYGDLATGAALTTSEVGYITVPFACTITGWHIMADAGTVTIKTARVNGGTALPTVGSNSISTSGVALSSGTKVDSTTVTDFTSTAIAANDTLGFFITAVATAKQITFQLDCKTI